MIGFKLRRNIRIPNEIQDSVREKAFEDLADKKALFLSFVSDKTFLLNMRLL